MKTARGLLLLALMGAAGPARAQSPPPLAPPAGAGATEAVLQTAEGEIVIRLLRDIAPQHVRLFEATARKGEYDGTTFHRIIAGGIVQGGDPTTKDPARTALYGTGGLGLLKAELSKHPFTRGTVAAVRRPSSMDSAGKQFFICLSEQKALEGQYTVFGEVVAGLEAADKISLTPVDGDKPKARVEIQRVTLRPATSP